jgi:hypothetical protein
MPDDDMGKGDVAQGGGSFVNHTIDHIAKEWGMSRKDTMQNMIELLQEETQKEKE